MRYSPKLKKLAGEIAAILKENNVAGFICLMEPGFGEFVHVIDPPFSCAKKDGDKITVSTKGLNVGAKEKHKIAANTSNMLMIISTILMEQGYGLAQISQQVDKELQAEHGPLKGFSQTELDN